MSRRISVT